MYQQGAGQTAAELRRQLHGIKARDREAAVFATQAPVGERFIKSSWFTGLITGSAVGLLLYITNPAFVQGAAVNNSVVSPPNLKRVAAWAVLAGLLVALGPLAYQKFSSPK